MSKYIFNTTEDSYRYFERITLILTEHLHHTQEEALALINQMFSDYANKTIDEEDELLFTEEPWYIAICMHHLSVRTSQTSWTWKDYPEFLPIPNKYSGW